MKLDEMLANLEKGFQGFWITPDKEFYSLGPATHEEWARQHNQTSASLLDKGWARTRVYQTAVMMETSRIQQIYNAIELAKQFLKKEIIFALHGRKTEYFTVKDGIWADDAGNTMDNFILQLEHIERP
jgi:hypothetical protein